MHRIKQRKQINALEGNDYMWEKIKKHLPTYLVAIAIPIGIGLLSALLTSENMMTYGDMVKPPLSPPAWLFPIAWTVLYALMGISSGKVYLERENNGYAASRGLIYYAVSLVVNFFWSIIFFNMRAYILAFIWLILLIYLVIRSTMYYTKVSPVSAYLQIPYIIWLAFAAYLNAGVAILN